MTNMFALAAMAAALSLSLPAQAGSIRVSPTKVEMAGNTASMLRVRNEEKTPVTVQVRVFRSIPAGNGFRLEETRDVVASPPMTTLRPGAENIVRIVHVGGSTAGGQRSYRLLVDEVPDRRRMKPGTVAVVVRHSIPVTLSD
ncbi:fimbria/pilus periplasmic chaperone [Aureimonas altamirensis]|uniref:fimbrial biogenesis chaperone n=1 Tax=Aureimonas altamirensis TaxID=370622 RepID=UPI001E63C88F|nr:fimbria/pilus periplasmic chaperone [Aureimonas altamirensis]UHD47620.1 fimbria/pilus periplasmic chaperone [Aureimonas altamirensis]